MPTFNISVECEHDIEPLSVEGIVDYIVLRLESQSVLSVTSIKSV